MPRSLRRFATAPEGTMIDMPSRLQESFAARDRIERDADGVAEARTWFAGAA